MKKFKVYITRTYIHDATIDIEAFTPEQAEKAALHVIGDHVMRIKEMVEGQDTAEVVAELPTEKA